MDSTAKDRYCTYHRINQSITSSIFVVFGLISVLSKNCFCFSETQILVLIHFYVCRGLHWPCLKLQRYDSMTLTIFAGIKKTLKSVAMPSYWRRGNWKEAYSKTFKFAKVMWRSKQILIHAAPRQGLSSLITKNMVLAVLRQLRQSKFSEHKLFCPKFMPLNHSAFLPTAYAAFLIKGPPSSNGWPC